MGLLSLEDSDPSRSGHPFAPSQTEYHSRNPFYRARDKPRLRDSALNGISAIHSNAFPFRSFANEIAICFVQETVD